MRRKISFKRRLKSWRINLRNKLRNRRRKLSRRSKRLKRLRHQKTRKALLPHHTKLMAKIFMRLSRKRCKEISQSNSLTITSNLLREEF